MKKLTATILAIIISGAAVSAQKPSSYVNPMIGTGGMGHTFPGACVPFGGVQLSPDTGNIPHNIDGVYQKEQNLHCLQFLPVQSHLLQPE